MQKALPLLMIYRIPAWEAVSDAVSDAETDAGSDAWYPII